jgi:hypothetical protein
MWVGNLIEMWTRHNEISAVAFGRLMWLQALSDVAPSAPFRQIAVPGPDRELSQSHQRFLNASCRYWLMESRAGWGRPAPPI